MLKPTRRQLKELNKRFYGNKDGMLKYLEALCTDKKVKELADLFNVTSQRIQLDRNRFTTRAVKKGVKKHLQNSK